MVKFIDDEKQHYGVQIKISGHYLVFFRMVVDGMVGCLRCTSVPNQGLLAQHHLRHPIPVSNNQSPPLYTAHSHFQLGRYHKNRLSCRLMQQV